MQKAEMIKRIRMLFVFFWLGGCMPALNAAEDLNLNRLGARAGKAQKHVFVLFHKEGCSYCERMIHESLDNPDIKSKLKQHFITAIVNINSGGNVTSRDFNGSKHAFAKSLKIGLYPSVVFMDENRSLVYGFVGYRKRDQFSKVLDYVSSGSYQKMDFESFENMLDFEEDN